jgi:hypothetical protein
MRMLLVAVISLGIVTGCGESKPPQKTVFDPLLQTKQKARDVEQKLQESAQRQKDEIEQGERGER